MREIRQEPNGAVQHTTKELVQEIIGDVQELIRSEVRLAKSELKEEGLKAGKATAYYGVGGLLGFFGLALGEAMCVVLWAMLTPLWIAFLIMGAITLVTAGIFAMAGYNQWQKVHPKPEKTVATLKEDLEWARSQTR